MIRLGTIASSMAYNSQYQTVCTDNFEAYTAGSTLDAQGNWLVLLNTFYVYTGKYVYPNTSAAVSISKYNTTFADNQFASITVSTVATASDAIAVAVRLSGTGATTCGYGYYALNGTQRLFRIDNGVKTNLGSPGTAALTVGDVLRLEVSGTTLTAYRNGVVDTGVGTSGVATVTEYTSGMAGVSGYNNGITSGDNFIAGNINAV